MPYPENTNIPIVIYMYARYKLFHKYTAMYTYIITI